MAHVSRILYPTSATHHRTGKGGLARIMQHSPIVKGITAAILVLAAAFASAANISVQSAFPSDSSGNQIQVHLGESFYMTAKLAIDAPVNGGYQVCFELPYAQRTSPIVSFSGQATVTWGPYVALLDGPMPVTVSVLSQTDEAGEPLSVSVTPTSPVAALEYFAPQNLSGSVGATAAISGGTVNGLQWYAPLPATGGFQRVLAATKDGAIINSAPFSQPVVSTPKKDTTSIGFETVASAARINSDLLRKVTFSSYRSIPSSASVWLRAETLVQSRSSEITAFVNRSLPRNFKSMVKPFDAAETLFQAVVSRMQYCSTPNRPDALTALRTGRGDCGYFSALFVASCRNIGIPARTLCGMTMGESQWHVWAEFWMPTYGWIPADPTFCETLCPDGSLPLYFGTIPELNQRVAVTYGFDHIAAGKAVPMMQSPVVFASGSTRVGSIQAFSNLSLANGN